MPLEGLPGVPEAEGHPLVLTEAEGGEWYWSSAHPLGWQGSDDIISAGKSWRRPCNQWPWQWNPAYGQRVNILFCYKVDPAEIAAGAPAAIRLLHHVQQTGPWRSWPLDYALFFQLLELRLCFFFFLLSSFSKLGSDGQPLCDDVVHNVRADRW